MSSVVPDATQPHGGDSSILREVLERICDPILVVNETGRIILRNKAARSRLQHSFGSSGFIPDDPPWNVLQQLVSSVRNGLRRMEEDIFDPAADRHWHVILDRLELGAGRDTHCVIHLRDESELRSVRRSLRTSEALARTGSILAGSAHQAKNALFAISATIESLVERHGGSLQEDPLMKNLKNAVNRMQGTLRDVFELGAAASEHRELVAAESLLREAVANCTQVASQHRVHIKVSIKPGITLFGAIAPLRRAFENVIDNAIRHSPENATVLVELGFSSQRKGSLQFAVTDSGRGFREDAMERLFDPYFTTRREGTGLGLTLARQVVEDHGGWIELANQSQGGARVTITLPIDRRTSRNDDLGATAELN